MSESLHELTKLHYDERGLIRYDQEKADKINRAWLEEKALRIYLDVMPRVFSPRDIKDIRKILGINPPPKNGIEPLSIMRAPANEKDIYVKINELINAINRLEKEKNDI